MCVIIVKKAGQKIPPFNFIKACAQANPDGFGFCTPKRGFKSLNFAEFYNHLIEVDESEPCIMHFRLATHGSIMPSNCHPFYDNGTNTWFAHNGILPIQPDGDMTDSETAFRNIIVPAIAKYGYNSLKVSKTIKKIIGFSKFALLNGKKIRIFGDYVEYNHYLCSNLRFTNYLHRYVS